jgi:ABC-type dipeptide/oligopeptide/nickel transport system ATPase subunit
MSCDDELTVKVDNISFSYGAKKSLCARTLKGITIDAKKGQLIGVMGRTAAASPPSCAA